MYLMKRFAGSRCTTSTRLLSTLKIMYSHRFWRNFTCIFAWTARFQPCVYWHLPAFKQIIFWLFKGIVKLHRLVELRMSLPHMIFEIYVWVCIVANLYKNCRTGFLSILHAVPIHSAAQQTADSQVQQWANAFARHCDKDHLEDFECS